MLQAVNSMIMPGCSLATHESTMARCFRAYCLSNSLEGRSRTLQKRNPLGSGQGTVLQGTLPGQGVAALRRTHSIIRPQYNPNAELLALLLSASNHHAVAHQRSTACFDTLLNPSRHALLGAPVKKPSEFLPRACVGATML